MRVLAISSFLAFGIAAPGLRAADSAPGRVATAVGIVANAEQVADAQMTALNGKVETDWIWATMYAGYAEFAPLSVKAAEYTKAVVAMGEKCQWTPRFSPKHPFHADDHAIGQTILDVYESRRDPALLAPLTKTLDALVDELNATAADPNHLTWSWCDALFMAPPVLAKMSALTGNRKYLDAMDKEWWKVSALLYDKDEHLFYRDSRFFNKPTRNGKKIFWARGNGWVSMGLARVLRSMPADYPSRAKYVAMFQEMMAKLAGLQSADGTWRTSLLDPEEYPNSEFSGTAFFSYAMAWGINDGLLAKATYLPVVAKAWSALLAMRRDDGTPGFVQGVSDRPGVSTRTGTQLYATGGLLLTAIELKKLAPFELPPAPKLTDLVPNPLPGAKTFVRHVPERMDDIAWESDRIAFRLYGPALEKHEATGSGIDVWCKSTPRLIVNGWYATGDYHHDKGDGCDCYSVGQTRGCGCLGIWSNNTLFVSHVWQDHRILVNTPDKAAFLLKYAPWDANGREVSESRAISLSEGSNLNRLESTISSPNPDELIVAVGIGTHKMQGHLVQDREHGILSYWEPADGGEAKNGMIGCAVLFDPAQCAGFATAPHDNLVLLKVTPGKPFVYYAGAGWSKSAEFKTEGDWQNYLREYKAVFR